jgi:hypothetical protein
MHFMCGPGSVVGIATDCGLDGPGIEFRWGRDFPHMSRPALVAHPASCTMGTVSFPWVKSGRGVTLTSHPFLVPWSCKSRAIPLLPYGPHGLYRASVPVRGCTLLCTSCHKCSFDMSRTHIVFLIIFLHCHRLTSRSESLKVREIPDVIKP